VGGMGGKRDSLVFTYVDVIERAIEIIQRDNSKYSWSDHGECCPWCAIAMAKGELDNENGNGIDTSILALSQYLRDDFIEVESDGPLILARKTLEQWNDINPYSITKSKAIEILLQAKSVIIV
jgi:hypothetical protein